MTDMSFPDSSQSTTKRVGADGPTTPPRQRRRVNYAPPRWLISVTFFIVVVGGWEVLVRVLSVPTYILPAPSEIAASFSGNMGELLQHTRVTVVEAGLGFVIGNGVALICAAIMAESKTLERGLYPYLVAFRSLPIVAVAPLLIIWFGFTIWPIVFAAALLCFFPTLVNALQGLKSVDEDMLQLMRGLNASRFQVFRKVRVYKAIPYVMASFKITVTQALVGAVVGEWIAGDAGLGYLTILANNYVDTTMLFRALIAMAILGTVWFLIITWVQAKLLYWETQEVK